MSKNKRWELELKIVNFVNIWFILLNLELDTRVKILGDDVLENN